LANPRPRCAARTLVVSEAVLPVMVTPEITAVTALLVLV